MELKIVTDLKKKKKKKRFAMDSEVNHTLPLLLGAHL